MNIRGLPFIKNGLVDVSECSTARQVIKKSGLDFTVEQLPVYFYPTKEYPFSIPNYFVNYRTDNNTPLGVVGRRYNVIQNIDAFKFFDAAIGRDKCSWVSAFETNGGAKIYIVAKLPNISIINNDVIKYYVTFSSSHDGNSSIKINIIPVREEDQVVLGYNINSSSFHNIKHSTSATDKLSDSKRILRECSKAVLEIEKDYEKLINIKMTDEEINDFICRFLMTDEEYINIFRNEYTPNDICNKDGVAVFWTKISARKANTIYNIRKYYDTGYNMSKHKGTAFGLFCAIAGYYTNIDTSSNDKRLESLLFGDKQNKLKSVIKELLKK